MAEEKKEKKEFCEKHPDEGLVISSLTQEKFCPQCATEKANEVIEESIEEEPSNEKPKLNAARLISFGAYKMLYDIQPVDEGRRIWKGRPVIPAELSKMPGAPKSFKEWVFFHRNYDDRNDWDRLYKEFEFENEGIIGQKFIAIPKEKLLFAYDPPPSGILLPDAGIQFGRG